LKNIGFNEVIITLLKEPKPNNSDMYVE